MTSHLRRITSRQRATRVALAAAIAVAIAPATACASTASIGAGKITVTAPSHEANDIDVMNDPLSWSTPNLWIKDAGAVLTAGAGCSTAPSSYPGGVSCARGPGSPGSS